MKSRYTSIVAILLAVGIATSVMTVTVQSVAAPRDCGSCQQFKKLTQQFEKNVIRLIGTNEGPQPHLREVLQSYDEKVLRIFIGDPNLDQIRTLLQSYEQDVTTIFDQSPPEPDKQLKKDFKKLTHNFVKDVIDAVLVSPPEPD